MSMVELYNGALNVPEIITRWYAEEAEYNYGAYIPFIGTVREEDGIEGLSFDVYEPILNGWFDAWQVKAQGPWGKAQNGAQPRGCTGA
jgi:molybdopterin synthase catalytic subunit